MVEQHENIKPRILIPVFSALVIIAVVAVMIIHYTQARHIESHTTTKIHQARMLLQRQLEEDTELLGVLNTHLHNNPALQEAWLRRDKPALLRTALPIFNAIKAQHDVTHFYFMSTDTRCYLRVHQPDRFGDIINRQTMQEAVNTGVKGTGVEFGPLGTLTLRVVYPWHFRGKLQGYIELGQEIDHAINNLHKLLGLEVMVFAHKKLINRERWEAFMQKLDKDYTGWAQFDDDVIISKTIAKSPRLESALYQLQQSWQDGDKPPTLLLESEDNRHLSASLIPLTDARGHDVGYIALLDDVTPEQLAMQHETTTLVSTTAVIILIIFAGFYGYIGRIEHKLLTSKQKLVESAAAREAALEEANQLKDRFLTNISHELRTPMNGIMGMLQILQETPLSERQKSYTKVALESAHNLLHLINDLFEITKHSAPADGQYNNVDLHALFKDTVAHHAESAQANNLDFSWHISPDTPDKITINPLGFTLVLNKLIGNAIKFTPGGYVTVFLRPFTSASTSGLMIYVLDTGIGIARHLQERIFHPFIQGDGSSTRKYGGSGLGLAIAKRVTEQMGGEIHVDSEPGEGSCFYFILPTGN